MKLVDEFVLVIAYSGLASKWCLGTYEKPRSGWLTNVQEKLQRNALIVLGLVTLTIVLVMDSCGLFFRKLVRKLTEVGYSFNRLATIDSLNGLYNRHAQ